MLTWTRDAFPIAAHRLPLWRLVPLLLCVLLLLPGFARASSPPPLVPSPSTSQQEDPYGGYDDAPPDDEPRGELIPRDWSPSRRKGPRIFLEALSGLTLGLVGITPGAYLGFALAASESSTDSSSDVLGAIALGFVGVTGGAALGVFGSGSLMGGEGGFVATLGGASVGALVGAIAAIPAALVVQGGWMLPVLVFPLVGAIIGYEQSHAEEHEREAQVAGTRIQMVPVLGVRPSGGLVAGLAGRF